MLPNKCRTASVNEVLLLSLSIDKGYSENKNRILPEKLVVSGRVEPTGEKSNLISEFQAFADIP